MPLSLRHFSRIRTAKSALSQSMRFYSNSPQLPSTPLIHDSHMIMDQRIWSDMRAQNTFFDELAEKELWGHADYVGLATELSKLPFNSLFHLEPPVPTGPKDRIANFVVDLVPELLNNRLRGESGGTSYLLLGPKGIGKTNTLKSLALCLSLKDPTLLFIYIDYNNTKSPRPSHFLKQGLLNRFPDLELSDEIDDIMREYSRRGLKAFVLVDELDQVYATEDNDHGRAILTDLAYLGSNQRGCNISIACGSSAVLPQLISRNGSHHEVIRQEYPLVKQCPNLNGTKYPSYRVGSGHPTSDKQYLEMWNRLTPMPKISSVASLNLLFFVAGSNMRNMKRVMNQFLRAHSWEDLEHNLSSSYNWDQRSEFSRTNYGDLIEAIQSKLIEKNHDLLKQIVDPKVGEIDFRKVIGIDWKLWVGLTHDELTTILQEQSKLVSDVQMLVDKTWFCAGPNVHSLHAISPAHLCTAYILRDYHVKEDARSRLFRGLQRSMSPVFESATNVVTSRGFDYLVDVLQNSTL